MRFVALIATLLLTGSYAFVAMPSARQAIHPTRVNLMSTEELETLISTAVDCSEGECSVDQVGDLVVLLQGQQKELNERIKEIGAMIKSLETTNQKDKGRDEVRETVRAIMRVFAKSDGHKASVSARINPTGYSGEVGSGPTDAYKALKPKPYKP